MVGVRTIAIAFACGVVVCVAVPAVGQESVRTSWGAPDLQGVWDFRTITPMQRPEQYGDREFLTEGRLQISIKLQLIEKNGYGTKLPSARRWEAMSTGAVPVRRLVPITSFGSMSVRIRSIHGGPR